MYNVHLFPCMCLSVISVSSTVHVQTFITYSKNGQIFPFITVFFAFDIWPFSPAQFHISKFGTLNVCVEMTLPIIIFFVNSQHLISQAFIITNENEIEYDKNWEVLIMIRRKKSISHYLNFNFFRRTTFSCTFVFYVSYVLWR